MKVLAAILLLLTIFPPVIETLTENAADIPDGGRTVIVGWIRHYQHADWTLYFQFDYHKAPSRWHKDSK